MAAPDCYAAACALLARREQSARELRGKLAERGYSGEVIGSTLARLVEQGLQSDQRFAEAFLRSRLLKGQGPERVRRELGEHGIAGDAVRALFDAEQPDWWALAAAVRTRKFGEGQPHDYAEKARQMRFLQYRGFTLEQIRFAMEG